MAEEHTYTRTRIHAHPYMVSYVYASHLTHLMSCHVMLEPIEEDENTPVVEKPKGDKPEEKKMKVSAV